jgi:hypothetical protein
MPHTIKQADFDFLVDLNAWVASGKAQGAYAGEIGVADGTITYRLKEHRLKSERGVGLVDRETGETFEARVDSGYYRLFTADEPAVEAAVA